MMWSVMWIGCIGMVVVSLCWTFWHERQLRRRRTAQTLFYASLGHELKTPLNGIIGFSELLQADGLGLKERKQYACDIEFSANVLLAMINNMLDCAKFNAGQMQLYLRFTQLAELVAELPAMLNFLLREKNLRLKIDLPVDMPVIYIDAERIRQILVNLIGNAIKFSDHGVISLSGMFFPIDGEVGKLTLSVTDQGQGISEEYQKKIFDPFVQQYQHAVAGKGTGLGLSISMRLLRLMNGSMELKSELGKGSCFTIILSEVMYKNTDNAAWD